VKHWPCITDSSALFNNWTLVLNSQYQTGSASGLNVSLPKFLVPKCPDSSEVSSRNCPESESPVMTCGGICVPPTVTYLSYLVSGSTLTAVGCSQLLARWPRTHSRILSGIQQAAQTVLGVYLKRTCSHVTSESSTLGVLNDYAL